MITSEINCCHFQTISFPIDLMDNVELKLVRLTEVKHRNKSIENIS